jgi:hypothetical protein
LGLKLEENHTEKAIKFSSTRGIVFGDIESGDLKTYLQVYCTNDTISGDLALEIEMSLQVVLNATIKDFVLNV